MPLKLPIIKRPEPPKPEPEPYELTPEVMAAQADYTAVQEEYQKAQDLFAKMTGGAEPMPEDDGELLDLVRTIRDGLSIMQIAARYRLEYALHVAAEAHLKEIGQENHEDPQRRAEWMEDYADYQIYMGGAHEQIKEAREKLKKLKPDEEV